MSVPLNKTVMAILLSLILIGQSMASSTMFYKMAAMSTMGDMSHTSSMSANMHKNMSSMVHESNGKNANDNIANCCKEECQCFASGCSAPSAFSKTLTDFSLPTLATRITNHNAVFPEHTLTSLFRPPILS